MLRIVCIQLDASSAECHSNTMKNWLAGIALMLLLCVTGWGCTSEADPDPWGQEEPVAVSYALSPEPALRQWLLRAAYRWNTARACEEGSGCEFVIDDTGGGIPVKYVPEILQTDADGNTLFDEKGQPLTAVGVAQPWGPVRAGGDWRYIHVAFGNRDPERTLVHELAHVLGVVEHTLTGVSRSTGGFVSHEEAVATEAWTINEETLSVVCARTLCMDQIPEEPRL